ncbi:MAG: glycosyltransferase family 92 protein [Synergistaceae bacterium]|nr:glycosyltransferase family 92 protein [Synergistaceae bacterium]
MWKKFRRMLKKNKFILTFVRVMKNAGENCPLVYHCRDYTQNDLVRTMIKTLVTPYYALKWFVRRDIPGREGLAFVLIAKNEATYIKEWLDFHIKQGVTHFFIYDNLSTDNFREVLQPYIDSGMVTYSIINRTNRQIDAYNMALHKYGKKFKYMAFIDGDEFVFVRKNPYCEGYSLYDFMNGFMKAHPKAGVLRIHWLMFGSSYHEKRPKGGVLKNFTMCAGKDFPSNCLTKFICDPLKILAAGVHSAMCRRGSYCMNEIGKIINEGVPNEVNFEQIRINHYFCKSIEEYKAIKMGRGDVTFGKTVKLMEAFHALNSNDFTDTEILSRI